MTQTRSQRRRWTQAENDDIGARFLAGEDTLAIAADHNATEAAIWGVIRRGRFNKRLHPKAVWRRRGPMSSDAAIADPELGLVNTGGPWRPHPAQRPPRGAWATWVFLGGRGAGKTRAGAEWLAQRAQTPNLRLALVGPTLHDVREVMVEGVSGLKSLPGRERPRYEGSRRRLRWSNGTVAYGFSAEDPDSLRGPQFHAAWADEFCAWRHPAQTLAMLRLGLRLGPNPRLAITATPKPMRALRTLLAEPGCRRTDAATAVNAANLSPSFIAGLEQLYGGTRLAEQELEGRLVEGDGGLWRVEDLRRCRGAKPVRFDRVVVGVDPPASAGGDACGLVVVGRLENRAFVLADLTERGLSPHGWGARVAAAARRFGAARVVAEANQGGEMVRAVLAAAGTGCAIRLVHARFGKRARAEPVAALYEQGRVIHCGDFPALEEELMALGADEAGGASPDRADALVWAITDLLVDGAGDRGPRVRWL